MIGTPGLLRQGKVALQDSGSIFGTAALVEGKRNQVEIRELADLCHLRIRLGQSEALIGNAVSLLVFPVENQPLSFDDKPLYVRAQVCGRGCVWIVLHAKD